MKATPCIRNATSKAIATARAKIVLILVIVTVVFIGTQIALGYVLWKAAHKGDEKALDTHGSHNLEVIWTIVPAGILVFIALYQMDVWAEGLLDQILTVAHPTMTPIMETVRKTTPIIDLFFMMTPLDN